MKRTTIFKIVSIYFILTLILSPTISLAFVTPVSGGIKTISGTASPSAVPGNNTTVYKPVSNSTPEYSAPKSKDSSLGDSLKDGVTDGLKQASSNAVGAAQNAGSNIGGGAAGACLGSVISSVAITATIAALTAVLSVIGVPSASPDTGLAGGFTSGTNFMDFLNKNCLDPAARAIYAQMLFKMNDSVLKWGTTANRTGLLNGSTFISDVGSYFNTVAEESVGTFISRQDKNNPFTAAITKNLALTYKIPDNNYTPNEAERILLAACNTYTKADFKKKLENNNLDINKSNYIDSFFNRGKTNFPSSVQPFKGGNISNGLTSFNYFLPQKAFAQSTVNLDGTRTSPSLGQDSIMVNTNTIGTPTNPCNRKATTAAEKQAVVDEYHAGKFKLTGQDSIDVLMSELEPKNNKSLAILFAKSASDQFVSTVAENEKLALTGTNNTGVRVCPNDSKITDPITGEKTCPVDKYITTVTPQIVNSQTEKAHQTSNEILQKLSSTATWKDLAKTIVTNLVVNLSNQLINSASGLMSFSGKSNNSSQGSFTQSIQDLNKSTASLSDIDTSTSNTAAYVSVLKTDSEAIGTLVTKIGEVQKTCSELLSIYSTTYSRQSLAGIVSPTVQNHECNIDQANLNYKDDPTAALRLTNNPIYVEVSQLDLLKQQLDQVSQVYTNSQNTLRTLKNTGAEYQNSQDVNKDITLSTQTALVLSQIPQDVDVTQKQAQLTDIQNRISRIDIILARLTKELAEAKGASPAVSQ